MDTGNIPGAAGLRHSGAVAAQRDDHMLHALTLQRIGNVSQIFIPRAGLIKAQGQMGLLRCLLLVGDQVGNQTQQFIVQFRGRSRVQDHRHTSLFGPMGHSLVYLDGDLQL